MKSEERQPGPRITRALPLFAALLLVACSSGGSPSGGASAPPAASPAASPPAAGSPAGSATGGATVTAALSEFKIELSATTAPDGSVTFDLSNKGTTAHEFVVFKTDLAADKMPLTADGLVDEEGAGVTLVDEVEDIEVGATPSLSVDLPAGHYVVLCNLPAHYSSGMHAEFTTN